MRFIKQVSKKQGISKNAYFNKILKRLFEKYSKENLFFAHLGERE